MKDVFGAGTLAFHRLGTLAAVDAARSRDDPGADLPQLPEDASLKQALMLMLDRGTDRVRVAQGGLLRMSDLLAVS